MLICTYVYMYIVILICISVALIKCYTTTYNKIHFVHFSVKNMIISYCSLDIGPVLEIYNSFQFGLYTF